MLSDEEVVIAPHLAEDEGMILVRSNLIFDRAQLIVQ
jgi:hypothetical protein